MMKIASIVLALLCYGLFLPCYAAQQSLEGDWVGGIDFGKSWQPVNFHFKAEKDGITGTLDLPQQGRNGLALNRVVFESSHVRIEWQGRSGLAIYEGELKDGGIIGNFQQGETRATFQLAHVVKVDPKTYDQYVGSYKLGHDRFVDIGTYDLLTFSDSKTGRTGSLYPLSETTFFSGSSVEIPLPVDLRVTFVKNSRGEVTSLLWSEKGARAISAKRLPHKLETVTFRNGDTTLTGTLILPTSKDRHPAIVKVDPGYSLYAKYGFFPYFFVRQGVAFLTLTQRSVNGKPTGYAQSSFEERAKDALAGVAMLKLRKDINPKQIGLHGSSLSSWVVPLAATLSPDVAFVILRVGSALPVPENILYEIESDLRQDNFSEDNIAQAKALRRLLNTTILTNTGWDTLRAALEKSKNERWFSYARVGWMLSLKTPPDSASLKELQDPISFDPVPVLQRVTVPVLAFNGELDKAVNTKASVPIMEQALRKAGNKDFTIIVLPHASHDLLEAKTGYNSEYPYLNRHAPKYWDTMTAWLRKHITVRK
jgi:dienelactone hydrolase